jgi:hypothetical protein
LPSAELSKLPFAGNDSFHLMPARQALKRAYFQTLERMRRPSNQTRIVIALAAANWRNKLLILHKEGTLVHKPPPPASGASAKCASCSPLSGSLPGQTTMLPTEDGEERATHRRCWSFLVLSGRAWELRHGLAVRPKGANHQWRKIPPGELSIDPVADERLGWATGRAGAS